MEPEIAQAVIQSHAVDQRFRGQLKLPDAEATVVNPSCGDRVTLYLRFKGDRIATAAFEGAGCALSMASASLVCSEVHGAASEEARNQLAKLRRCLDTGTTKTPADSNLEGFGELGALLFARHNPARVPCARLGIDAFFKALTATC